MTTTHFIDSPDPDQFKEALDAWQKPPLPREVAVLAPMPGADFCELGQQFRERVGQASRLSGTLVLDWLYALVQLNIKRGRIFDLREVLQTGKADCLGYCKIFAVLARSCGLDAGVVDVVIDNRGLAVPHTVVLVRAGPPHLNPLPGGNRRLNMGHRFVDFWYGSADIHHRRLGLRVKRGGEWQLEDIDWPRLKCSSNVERQTPNAKRQTSNSKRRTSNVERQTSDVCQDFTYLPDSCVDGITLYIEGNRFLKDGDYADAIAQYSQAATLYPLNTRVFYNRAIAYEKLGEPAKASIDYKRALADPTATQRTLATQPEEIVDLIQLDEQNISELAQQVYLLHQGFVTGRKVSATGIARRLGLSVAEVEDIMKRTLSHSSLRGLGDSSEAI